VYDDSGTVKAGLRLPQDVTAVTWSGRQLVVGDADGRLIGLTVR
jgi:hypothetical protein